jgi:ferredoxin-NADP reductase
VVFIAGGVGINPIMSMLEHLYLESYLEPGKIRSLRLLYGTRARAGEAVLFYERIGRILLQYTRGKSRHSAEQDYKMAMHLTGPSHWSPDEVPGYDGFDTDHIEHKYRRINNADLIQALGPVADRKNTVAYACGPPEMTDEFVETLNRAEGMDEHRVLCEKWW